jgi:multicomponent Na+:H+ antiporter subunit D
LFLVALACLSVGGTAGALVYVAAHAGVKGALFLVAGVLLNRYGSVDELDLYGAGCHQRVLGWVLVVGALALSGLPPFGTALGKALGEDAGMVSGYWWVPFLFVAVSAVTAGAILRVAGRVFWGLGPRPVEWSTVRASGSVAQPESRFERVPATMAVAIGILLAGALAIGVLPGVHSVAKRAAATFIDSEGYARQALHGAASHITAVPSPNWTALGLGLSFLSAVLACLVALGGLYGRHLADRLPAMRSVYRPVDALQRLHSGHVGDYVAFMMVGMVVLSACVGFPLR